MTKPTEHKTVQNKILKYAKEIGWDVVSRSRAETLRGFDDEGSIRSRAKDASLFFDDLLFQKVREFNPDYKKSQQELISQLKLLSPDIFGNQDFLQFLKREKTFFHDLQGREFNLKLIDCEDISKNTFQVTEEYYFFNGKYGNREDVVFLINGIPVFVIECKNVTKDEALSIGIDQLRRYHSETPEMLVPQQVFGVTEALGLSYGVTWNLVRRNIFNWRGDEVGKLENKIKTFFDKEHALDLINKYIMFAQKDEKLHKYILRQHQQEAVDLVVKRALNPQKTRGLVWHTQGSGKTFTMLKAADLLFEAAAADKPTILLMLDRNELEDQMLKNLEALGMENVKQAKSIKHLNKLLKDDFRGVVVTMIHKFQEAPKDLNTRSNIYVLIDEAHRTTGGDLGNYLMAAIPNANYIGFTGTPVDKTDYGQGTFKVFGIDDKKGYLHKYSISDSIRDGTTLPLFYSLAENEFLVPRETLEKEFLQLAESYGVNDVEELNKILERAVNTRNFLKGEERIDKIAKYVANHYQENVEPMGYKAFLVAVDREACAMYKTALDKYLPKEYSDVIYSSNHNDSEKLKRYHYDSQTEKTIRKKFTQYDEAPKILIVTSKLLTGFDAPLLYAMYLDKPMRDHTLLQAVARVNRPYENQDKNMVKPHGFVLDFVGIFDKLEQALAFDSDEVKAVIKDIDLLKQTFEKKMINQAPKYLKLVSEKFDDHDVDNLIDHFRNLEKRKKFFEFYKETEMLYEVISPDKFLYPFLEKYKTLVNIYNIVKNAFSKKVYVDKELQQKTNELVQEKVSSYLAESQREFFEINEDTLEKIKKENGGDNTKVVNLVKNIQKKAEEESADLFLLSLSEKAQEVMDQYQERQITTRQALERLEKYLSEDIKRQKEQQDKKLNTLDFYILKLLEGKKIPQADKLIPQITEQFRNYPHWQESIAAERELRLNIYRVLFSQVKEMQKVAAIVDNLFEKLYHAYGLK
jgi:type I restriction enzyme R subunit